MKKSLRDKFLSEPRFARYYFATSRNAEKAKRLYNANLRLAQAFQPLLAQFEVTFRNGLNHQLSIELSDRDWIINQKAGFMSDRSLRHSNFFLKKSVERTERNLRRKGISITSGRIISDQTFGFWVALFLPHHYGLVRGAPIHALSYKPASEGRAGIHRRLDEIRKFRNRVSHCEPICFSGAWINCSEALTVRQHIFDLVSWMDHGLPRFFAGIDNVRGKVTDLMRI